MNNEPCPLGQVSGVSMARATYFASLVFTVACLLPLKALAQGETTSAIVGQVRDTTNAVVPGATVTITNRETGLKRSARTDDAGRFNFPQLKPGTYSVRAEAQGFDPEQNDNVISGLGQKQTVDFTLKVARSNEAVEVSSEAPIINPENANTSTTLTAPALEDLPNPGGDLTYPLQFAPGALINTAGSSNDFVGGSNGYGNVEFNGLPALSNGYIVDGLETNDPLTNLNSGLSTNLVLGLNSISEVTVNTLSYSVDQGRYGASQVDYVTKSGTNQFHGNLYELWNGSLLNAADYFTNATPGNHKPGSTVNHFGGSLGGPIAHDKLFFFFDSEWVRIALPIVTPTIVPSAAFQQYVLQQLPSPSVPFYQQMFSLYGNTSGTPTAILGCPLGAAGDGCANRQSVSHSSDDHEQVQTVRVDYNINPERYGLVSLSVGHRSASRVDGSYQPGVRCVFPATPLFFRGRTHARLLAEPGELLQSGVLLVREPVRAKQPAADTFGVSDCVSRAPARMPSRQWEGLTTPGFKGGAHPAFSSTTISPGVAALMNCGSEPISVSSA